MATSIQSAVYTVKPGPVVVCVGDSPAAELIKAAAAQARDAGVSLKALHITRHADLVSGSAQLADNLALAENLGAEVITRSHNDTAQGIITYIRSHSVGTLFIGRSTVRFWHHWMMNDISSQVLLHTGDVNVQVIGPEVQTPSQHLFGRVFAYLMSVLVVMTVTGLLHLIRSYIAEADIIMAYLAVVVVLAYAFDRGPTLFSAILSVAMFDFFFVTPFYTFAVDHEKYLISFVVMAAIGFMFSSFSEKLKQQLRATSARERHLRDLYQLARSLAAASSNEEIYRITRSHLAALGEANVGFFRHNDEGVETLSPQQDIQPGDVKLDNIRLCLQERCELIENDHSKWDLQYFPVGPSNSPAVIVARIGKSVSDEQRNLLHTGLSLVNLAVTRTQLSEQATQAELQAESEKLRNAILSAVSHDLRTPLGTIMGLVSTLLDREVRLDAELTTEFLTTIYSLSEQLSQKVTNLLQMSRTLGGKLQPRLELQNPEELIGGVLSTMKHRLENRQIQTDLDDTLLVAMDLSLMEVVLSNLIDNAVKFSPLKSTIFISGKRHGQHYEISVRDQGNGLDNVHDQHLFEQFYRSGRHDTGGTGLGLAITRAIVEAHGGRVYAENAAGKGAVFTVQLPLETPPQDLGQHES